MKKIPDSVAEIKAYFRTGGEIPETWLEGWERDSRQGIRRLAIIIRKRHMEKVREKKRLARLYTYERELWVKNAVMVAGVDEVGRGPLAGPVVAAAVILPGEVFLRGLNDSKKVSEKKRKELAEAIKGVALCWSLGIVSAGQIDRLNIRQAGLLAMKLAVSGLSKKPDHLLVDGFEIPAMDIHQTPLVGGDSLSASIAAASIIAKVARDEMMERYHRAYPGYGFAKHKGYGTKEHFEALERLGPSPIHRRSFL